MIKVSICIPTYNQDDYVEIAVRSAFEQSIKPFEIIVLDDCSTDNTYDILNKLSLEIPILKIKRQSSNCGIAANVDACLRLASGDFIIRLDSDDQLLPDYTKQLSELLLKYPEAGYAHAAVQEIDQYGKFSLKRTLLRKNAYQNNSDALKMAIKGYKVAANIIMFRKVALEKVNYVTGRPNYVEDYHLTTSISAAGFGNVYSDNILSNYRVWIDSGKVRQKRKLLEIKGLRAVFEDVIEPYYVKHGWNLRTLKKSKNNLACKQADCLSWNVYNDTEKAELTNELLKFSSSPKVKFFIWGYLKGFGKVISLPQKIDSLFKGSIKSILLKYSYYKSN